MRLHPLLILILLVLLLASYPDARPSDAAASQEPAAKTPVDRVVQRKRPSPTPDPFAPKKQMQIPVNPDPQQQPQPQPPQQLPPKVTADKTLIQLGDKVNFPITPIDTLYSLTFDFDDGDVPPKMWSSDKPPVWHRFTKEGTHTVTITVNATFGVPPPKIDPIEIKVERVTLKPVQGAEVGIPVTFKATSVSTNPKMRYNFTFGDGSQTGWQETSEATHPYSAAGEFSAKVEVGFEDDGETILYDSTPDQLIQITAASPEALLLKVEPTRVNPNQLVKFSASFPANGRHLQYKFVFDPNDESAWQDSAQTTHSYTSGIHEPYVLVGVVLNDTVYSLTKSAPQTIEVVALPPPPNDFPWIEIIVCVVILTCGGLGGYQVSTWFPPKPAFVPSMEIGSTDVDYPGAASLINFELHLDPNLSGGLYEVATSEPKLIRAERSHP